MSVTEDDDLDAVMRIFSRGAEAEVAVVDPENPRGTRIRSIQRSLGDLAPARSESAPVPAEAMGEGAMAIPPDENSGRLVPGTSLSYHQYGRGGLSHHLLRHASQKQVAEPGPPVSAHDNEIGDLLHDPRSSWALTSRAEVPLPGDEPAVPGHDGVRADDGGDFAVDSATATTNNREGRKVLSISSMQSDASWCAESPGRSKRTGSW